MVHKRHVYFIGGFDPNGASRFYQQHKSELARYSQLSNVHHALGPRQRIDQGCHRWTVQTQHPTGTVHTTFDYLAWDDIVRSRWARTPWALVAQAVRSFKDFVCSGAARRLHRLSPATVRTALFPYALVLFAIASIGLASTASHIGFNALGMSPFVTYAITALITVSSLAIAWRLLSRTPLTWFLRVVDFANGLAHNESAALDARIKEWAYHINATMQNSLADEVMVVGYSAGSSIAVAVIAQCAEPQHNATAVQPPLALLTLGNCVPVAASLPAGSQVRADIAKLAQRAVPWVDFTAPIDWGAFALADVVSLYAPAYATGKALRSFNSPQFHLLYDPSIYQKIKKDKYRVHQLYLQCTQRIGRYDYFAMVYGPQSLIERIFTP